MSDSPAVVQESPASPAERLHPFTPFVKGWVGLLAIVFFGGRSWLENGGRFEIENLSWWAWLLLVGLLVSIIAGFISWRATTFRLDDDALRLQTAFIWNSSTVVNYSKIQAIDIISPLAARLVGVCGLSIDVGAGSPQKLEFLGRRRAESLRDELSRRAALVRSSSDEPAAPALTGPEAGAEAEAEATVVRVSPTRLVAAVATSGEFFGAIMFGVGSLVPSIVTGRFAFAGLLVPAALGIATLIANRVVKEWNHRLIAVGPGVVRISRGLTDTVSQTIPVERVQGFEVTQSWLWRRMGWWRVRFNVLGNADDSSDEGASNVLLPVGTADEVRRALQAIWPNFDPNDLDWQGLPRRARWLHPFDWRQRGWAVSDEVIADRSGRLSPRLSAVAHRRVQSWGVQQGPWDRRLGLAGFAVHISGSVVDVSISGVEPSVAREWLESYSERQKSLSQHRASPGAADGQCAAEVAGAALEDDSTGVHSGRDQSAEDQSGRNHSGPDHSGRVRETLAAEEL